MKETVSIIIPLFNGAEYIKNCIESILNLEESILEIIIVDDGSTDNWEEAIKTYIDNNKIRVIRKEHTGLISTRKKGVLSAKGSFIGFVDCDDDIIVEEYKKIIDIAANGTIDIVSGGYVTVDEMGNEISETTNTIPAGFYCSEKLHSLYWKMMMYKGGCGVIQSTCTKLYRRSILEKVLEKIPENITIGEDAAITYSSLLACKRVMLIDNIVYRYYQRQGSMSKKHDLGIFNSIKIFYDYLYHKCEDAGCIGITNNLKEYTLWLLNIAFNVSFDIKANILWKTDTLFTKCGRRVVLYGAGDVGQSYYDQLSEQDSVDVVAWADKGNYGNVVSGVVLIHPDAILDYKFDSVVIAVAGNKLADKIKDHLIELGVEEKQILWEQPIKDYRRWYFS